MSKANVLATGVAGFIGHHRVAFLKGKDYSVRGVGLKGPAYASSDADELTMLDLRHWESCQKTTMERISA